MGEHSYESLHELVSRDKFYHQVKARVKNPNLRADTTETLFHAAVRSKEENSEILQLLLSRGADVNIITGNRYTPLHFAVCSQQHDTITALLEAGASVNDADFLGRTALHFAIAKKWGTFPGPHIHSDCDMWIVEKLLCHPEIIVDPVDETGATPLVWAVKEGNCDALETLLKKGANPNFSNEDNQTPLHVALYAQPPKGDIVSLLLENGADIYCEDNLGQTPVDILIRTVCDNRTLSFASYCLLSIALRYRIRKSLKRKLEKIPILSHHLDECCREVRLMWKAILYEKITVHDFVLGCFQMKKGQYLVNVYIPAVKFLLSGFCRKYFDWILESIPYRILCKVLHFSTATEFCLHCLPDDASIFDVFDGIECFYGESVSLRNDLRRLKEYLVKLL